MLVLPLFPFDCYLVKSDSSNFQTIWLFYIPKKTLLQNFYMLFGVLWSIILVCLNNHGFVI